MIENTYRTGKIGEQQAAEYLEAEGYEIICRNFRNRRGEIDLIAEKDTTIIFFEIKYLENQAFENLEFLIDTRKQNKIISISKDFLLKNPGYRDYYKQYDAVFIQGSAEEVYHIKNAFFKGGVA